MRKPFKFKHMAKTNQNREYMVENPVRIKKLERNLAKLE